MEIVEQLTQLVQNQITNESIFLVEIKVSTRKPKKVMIVLDGDKGVGIEECAAVSRALNEELDKMTIFEDGQYYLEVSSPGLDQPLKLLRQYKANIGRNLELTLKDNSKKNGTLTVVEEHQITLTSKPKKNRPETQSFQVLFEDIKTAVVQIALSNSKKSS